MARPKVIQSVETGANFLTFSQLIFPQRHMHPIIFHLNKSRQNPPNCLHSAYLYDIAFVISSL